ncbi:MarR family winged helix-turn-helix transcriptional regulator [Sinomonas notoginsengisoli]|uniref:MarR family winged helix-turn-helix transcriptional regulator n=1 Tax=Sinomonas notoginsengisoli TaxID=1457311 RepID=UPI001F3F498E|nr:MarR family transcriptional regulator [Sinomonas notoginsengisoli]
MHHPSHPEGIPVPREPETGAPIGPPDIAWSEDVRFEPEGADDPARSALRSSPGFELLFLLQRFTNEADRYAETVRRMHGLARNDVHALNAVMEAERQGETATPGALRERLVLSSAAMTSVIDRLEASGHLERRHSLEDRRQIEVSPTPSARETGREMFDPMVQHMLPVLAEYTPEQLWLVTGMINRLTQAITEARIDAAHGQAH